MKSQIAVLFAFFLAVHAKVPVTNNNNPTESIQLTDLIAQAQTNINNLAKQIEEQLNLPDQETVVNTVKEQTNNFVVNVQAYMQNVTEEVKNKSPELERLWADVKTKLSKVVDDINTISPNAEQQVTQLQAKFQEGIQVLLKESDNTAKVLRDNTAKVQEEGAKITKQALDLAVQTVEDLNNQLKRVAAPKA